MPWLRQGDVFESLPLIRSVIRSGRVKPIVEMGAAVLVTADCQMDKRTSSGKLKPDLRLQFVPLRPLAEFGDRALRIGNGDVQPPEAFPVGEHDGIALAGLLGEVFYLPAQALDAHIEDFSGNLWSDSNDPNHIVVGAGWARLFTMEQRLIDLLHRKMWLFWTAMEPDLDV